MFFPHPTAFTLTCQHDNDGGAFLPDHAPHVVDGVGHDALGGDVLGRPVAVVLPPWRWAAVSMDCRTRGGAVFTRAPGKLEALLKKGLEGVKKKRSFSMTNNSSSYEAGTARFKVTTRDVILLVNT